MRDITINEMKLILTIFKSPNEDYNANSISRHVGISPMGALKIAKKLEKDNILISRNLGRAIFYKLNFNNDYAKQYIKFLLRRESEQAHPYVKRWINEVKKIKNADSAVLFGSVLKKYKEAKDIDVLLIINKKKFQKLKKEIEDINKINVKHIHPIYQTDIDFNENIKKENKVLLNAVKGIVVFGEDKIIELLKR